MLIPLLSKYVCPSPVVMLTKLTKVTIQDVGKFIHLKLLCSHLYYYSNVLDCMSSHPFSSYFHFLKHISAFGKSLMYKYFNFINSASFQLVRHSYFIYTWLMPLSHLSIILLASQQNKLWNYLYCVLHPFPICRRELFMELVMASLSFKVFLNCIS